MVDVNEANGRKWSLANLGPMGTIGCWPDGYHRLMRRPVCSSDQTSRLLWLRCFLSAVKASRTLLSEPRSRTAQGWGA